MLYTRFINAKHCGITTFNKTKKQKKLIFKMKYDMHYIQRQINHILKLFKKGVY